METPSTLFVVATPIGNMGDISERAKATLRAVELVVCEDTRVTGKLLAALGIHAKLESCHEHSDEHKLGKIVDELAAGKSVALVTDAGTPGISDPGGVLVSRAVRAGVRVVPIPGPSAVVAALSICGFPADVFTFLGFPPHKKGRETFFKNLDAYDHAIVIYEATHRIEKTLAALAPAGRHLVVCRELTKIHETIYRGTAEEVIASSQRTSSKGEFVIVLAPKKWKI